MVAGAQVLDRVVVAAGAPLLLHLAARPPQTAQDLGLVLVATRYRLVAQAGSVGQRHALCALALDGFGLVVATNPFP